MLLLFFPCTPTTETYTLSLHDALPISQAARRVLKRAQHAHPVQAEPERGLSPQAFEDLPRSRVRAVRSEEHTSELQSHSDLVCRLLLEKKKNSHDHS